MNIRVTHSLLTDTWRADVDAMESAIRRFPAESLSAGQCHIAFFEIPRDKDLHVNVTHTQLTEPVSGWAGPADRPEGFVHNRRFDEVKPDRIVRIIGAMVFAPAADRLAHRSDV